MCPTLERIVKIFQAIQLLKREPTAQNFLHLLGLMASCIEIVPHARLFMRPVQLHLLHYWRPISRDLQTKIPINSFLEDHLKWWKRKFSRGKAICPIGMLKSTDNRCFKDRFRKPYERSKFSRSLVRTGENFAHKLSRVGSRASVNTTFSSTAYRTKCVDKIRLNDRSTVYKQTRGDSLSTSLLPDMEVMEHSNKKQNLVKGSPSSKRPEHSGRPIIESGNTSDRMVFRQSDSPENFPYMGHSNDRFICNRTKSQASNVLIMAAEPVSICHRRSVDSVGKHGSICISTHNTHSESASAYEEISLPTNSDCSTMAQKELVYGSPSDVDRFSNETTNTAELAQPTGNQDLPSKSSSVQSSCMAAINRSFESKGFSEQSRKNYWQHPGGQAPKRIMLQSSKSSVAGAVNGKLIHIKPL